MSDRRQDSTLSALLRFPSAAESRSARERLEEEIIGLFEQYRAPLLRYTASFRLGFSDGEEVVQDTFVSLFQHLAGGKPRANLRAWLFRVTHNLVLKRHSRIRRESEACDQTTAEEAATDLDLNPEEQLIEAQARQTMMAVFQALPEQDRRCLALRAEGLTYREIAKILNVSLGAVSLSLTRSIAKLTRATER